MVRRGLLVVLLLFYASPSHAQWRLDGVLVSAALLDRLNPHIVSDGSGGAVIAWQDFRSGAYDIYAQRVNPSGALQWAANGVVVCSASGAQDSHVLIPDGSGGAIIAWHDTRGGGGTGDIYAQRVNSAGTAQWTANGVVICTAAGVQLVPAIIADGSGGAIITWRDHRSGGADIYAQRVNSAGVAQWTADGVVVCNATNDQYAPCIASDAAAGAIIAWEDYRTVANGDIYAQRINSAGAAQWTANGIQLCGATGAQTTPVIVADGAGGGVAAWQDMRAGNNDVYAQRVNGAGVAQWSANGVAACAATGDQITPAIVTDGANGAIVVWTDARAGNNDIYAQRLDATGVVRWSPNGTAVCSASVDQFYPAITSDTSGGALIAWIDARTGDNDVYAQRMNPAGIAQWATDGLAACTVAGGQDFVAIAGDGAGGAMLSWNDDRSGHYNIYAQRLEGNYGYWGRPEPTLVSVKDVRNDEGRHVAVNWTASARDIPAPATIDHYSIWRAVDTAPGGYYWELAGTQPATRFATYSFAVETRADSVLGNQATEYFMVTAHAQPDEHVAFTSNVLTGHSVDNLAPLPPLGLVAQRDGSDVRLTWHPVQASDLRDYIVYRAAGAHVAAIAADALANTSDTLVVDAGAPTGALDYRVVSVDVHGNRSPASNDAAVAATDGTRETPALTRLEVLQNRPNPFNATTEMEIGLPSASTVQISIYDVAGRRVRAQTISRAMAGWQEIEFDGRNDAGSPLSSGVYFYRVTAGASTITRKLVIAR